MNFAGCAIVVSHDRYFLDRVATHIIACEGDSKWHFFAGNYAEYEANRMERLGETSIKRIKYANKTILLFLYSFLSRLIISHLFVCYFNHRYAPLVT